MRHNKYRFCSALFLFRFGVKMGRGIRLVWSSRGTQCGCADGGMDLGSFWEHVSLKLVLKSFQRVLKEIADFQTSCLQFPKTILEPTWLKHIFEMKQKTILETFLENIWKNIQGNDNNTHTTETKDLVLLIDGYSKSMFCLSATRISEPKMVLVIWERRHEKMGVWRTDGKKGRFS